MISFSFKSIAILAIITLCAVYARASIVDCGAGHHLISLAGYNGEVTCQSGPYPYTRGFQLKYPGWDNKCHAKANVPADVINAINDYYVKETKYHDAYDRTGWFSRWNTNAKSYTWENIDGGKCDIRGIFKGGKFVPDKNGILFSEKSAYYGPSQNHMSRLGSRVADFCEPGKPCCVARQPVVTFWESIERFFNPSLKFYKTAADYSNSFQRLCSPKYVTDSSQCPKGSRVCEGANISDCNCFVSKPGCISEYGGEGAFCKLHPWKEYPKGWDLYYQFSFELHMNFLRTNGTTCGGHNVDSKLVYKCPDGGDCTIPYQKEIVPDYHNWNNKGTDGGCKP